MGYADPEARRAYFRVWYREWYQRNRAAVLERQQERRRAKGIGPRPVPDPEARRARARAYYVDQVRERVLAQYRDDPDFRERTICRASERSARLRFGGSVIPWQVYAVLRSMPCNRCGTTPANGVDHVLPRVAGGRHDIENLQPLCPSCNSQKVGEDRRRASLVAVLRDAEGNL